MDDEKDVIGITPAADLFFNNLKAFNRFSGITNGFGYIQQKYLIDLPLEWNWFIVCLRTGAVGVWSSESSEGRIKGTDAPSSTAILAICSESVLTMISSNKPVFIAACIE